MSLMKEIVEGFRALIKTSSKITKLLNDYAKLKERPTDNAYVMERRLVEVSKIATTLADFDLKNLLVNWLNQEKKEIERLKEEFRFTFGEQLRTLFQQDNKEIKGQYPILRVGFYTLVLNFEFGEATLYFGPQIEKLRSKIPLESATVYQTIKKFDEDLKKITFDPKELYLDLENAYKRRLAILNKPYGEKVLLVDVLDEYVILKQPRQFFIDPKKENYREFSRVELAYLLYLFKKSEFSQSALHLYVATFDATTDKRESIWIPDDEEGEGTYYGYMAIGN
ncbi:MAG: hypothetical protein ACUVQ3_04685 [bacterium]